MSKELLEDVRLLSMQLNRQAFARPPVDGWLNSFLTMVYERFASQGVHGIQIVQVIGNSAAVMSVAGKVPAEQMYALDSTSPLTKAIETRQLNVVPDSRVYPILMGEDVIGLLIAFATRGDFDDAFNTITLQLGPALAQSFRTPGVQTGRLTQQVERLRSLLEATQSVAAVSENSEVIKQGVRTLVETLRTDRATAALFDLREGTATVVAVHPGEQVTGQKSPLVSNAWYQRLLTEKAPFVVNDAGLVDPQSAQNVKTLAMFPLLIDTEVLGAISLESLTDGRQFSADEIEGAMAIAYQLALSVQNSQLYDQMRLRAAQLEQITALGRRITGTFSQQEIFQILQEEIPKLVETDLISIAIRPGDEPILWLHLFDDWTPTQLPLAGTGLRFVLEKGDPLVLDDITNSDSPDYRIFAQKGMRAALIIPLILGSRTMGTLNVLDSRAGQYSSLELAVLEQVGSQLAVALENARLFAEAAQRSDIERLTNRLATSIQTVGDMQNVLLTSVQQVAEALNARRARVRLHMTTQPTLDAGRVTDKIIQKLQQKGDK